MSNRITPNSKFARLSSAVLISVMLIVFPGNGFSRGASSNSQLPVFETPSDSIPDKGLQQIGALMREKATRSPARRKMDSQLVYGIKMHRHEKIADGVDKLEVNMPLAQNGEAIVDINAAVSQALLDKLEAAGATILNSHPQYRSIRARIDINKLDAIAAFPEVTFIGPMQDAIAWQEKPPADPDHLVTTNPGFEDLANSIEGNLAQTVEEFQTNSYSVGIAGVRKSEGDVTHRAAIARNLYGVNGTGVKIGVLSDGVRNLSAAQASGDIGPVLVLAGQSGTSPGQCSPTASCDEGTAMLEIVHDIAPGAQLYFATAFGGSANFANNIRNLSAAGCDIIIDDVFYFAESPFQDGQAPGVIAPTNGGIVTQAVNDVTASGALYFSSSGNSGNKNDGTSGVWEGDFVDGGAGTGILAGAGQLHQFPGGLTYDVVTTAGSSQYNLNWSDPLGGSANDYDLYMLNAAGTSVITAGTNVQTGTQDPFEAIGIPTSGGVPVPNVRLVIARFTGVGRFLRVTTNRGVLSVSTPGATSGHSCSAGAFGVAAVRAVGPFPGAFSAANQVETFSSDGPRKLFYNANSTPITPGDVSNTGGISRQKPDITAADGVSVTGAGGFGIQFFGTSAAAPHAGAIAALLKSWNLALTPAQIRTALQSTAIDNEAPGVDRDSGYGIIMPDSALASLGAVPGAANVNIGTITVSDVGGNNNGFLEPGERATLAISLANTGAGTASAVSATLVSTTPGFALTPSATRSYPDIAATSGVSSSATPFEFVVQTSATYAVNAEFVLIFTYNGTTRQVPFVIPTGQLLNTSTTLDAVAPVVPAGAGYTAVTAIQAGRMNFTFPIAACGLPKTTPGSAGLTAVRRYDAYTFTNTAATPICATVSFNHPNTALLYAAAYIPNIVPATVATNWAADNGGSSTSGAGTTQLFALNVPAGQTFTVVVSETNNNPANPSFPYSLRVTGLPATAVPANQAPVNSVPAAQSMLEDGTLAFSAANANAISISDPDAGNNPVDVTLSSTNGVLTLGGTAGLTFISGDGTSDASMTFSGASSAINAALNGLAYKPAADFNGSATVTITTSDRGFTGTGGVQTDTDSVTVNITPVNDAPSFSAGANQTVDEDSGPQSVANWATAISAGPADEAGQSLSFAVTNSNAGLFSAQPAISAGGTLTYTSAPNANGSATVTVSLSDNGGTANGGADTSAAVTLTITITPVNDPPVANAGANQTLECTGGMTPVSLSGTATDVDGDTLTYRWSEGATILGTTASLNTQLPAGAHTLTFRATDPSNAFSESTVTITIVDTTAPTLTSNGVVISSWPVNKKYQTVRVSDLVASAGDACGTSVNLGNVVIAKVTSDEGTLADNDIIIGPGCTSVQLRADRNGNGDGRVYTITFRVTDAAGNSSTLARQVFVPHDQGQSSAVDSGVAYTVNGSCP